MIINSNKMHLILLFSFLLITIFGIIDCYSHDNYSDLFHSKVGINFENYLLSENNNFKPQLTYNLLESLTKYYSDNKINLNFGKICLYQMVPKGIQESLQLLEGNSYLPLGLSLELDTKLGKIKTEVESAEKKINFFKISNNLGPFSLYYDLRRNEDFSLDLRSTAGLNLNFEF